MVKKQGGTKIKLTAALLTVLFSLTSIVPSSFSAAYEYWGEDEDLNIGIPSAPSLVRRSLPETKDEPRMEYGPFTLFPGYFQSVEYDDNIKLRKEDEIQDVIFTERPFVEGQLEFGDHKLLGGYGVEFVQFAKDEEENATNHFAHLLLDLNFKDLQITAEDSFERSTSRLFNETSVRDELLLNTIQVFGRYDRPKWAGEVGWTHNTIDHQTPALNVNDYGEDILSILGGYKVLPKTLALLELDLGRVNYDTNVTNADQHYWQIFGGVRGELAEDFEFTAKVGYQGRDTGNVAGEPGKDNYSGMVAHADLVYRISDSDVLRSGYDRTVKTSTFLVNSWYRQDQIFISYRKRFYDKWYLTPRVSWQMNDYPETTTIASETRNRDDHFWQAGVRLQYQIQDWIWAGVKYNYRNRNSNYDTFDFSNNRFIADLTLAF